MSSGRMKETSLCAEARVQRKERFDVKVGIVSGFVCYASMATKDPS